MIFTEAQVNELLEMIEFQHSFFIAGNISKQVLSDEDLKILRKHGIDPDKYFKDYTPFEKAFYFGRLAAILGAANATAVTYKDFQSYIRRGQFVPLSAAERETLRYLERKTYGYIKGLGQDMRDYLEGKILEENLARREYYESIIGDAIKRGVVERKSTRSIVSDLRSRLHGWKNDLARIAETELQNAYEYGKIGTLKEIVGNDSKRFYKQVYPGACKYCIKLYLTNGIGSEPRLFTYEELVANGSNIGRKAKDWKPVIGTVHPCCRCDLRVKRHAKDVWNPDKGIFEPEKIENKKVSLGDIKITVGDKKFVV